MSFILKRPIVYPPLTGEEPQWFMNLWENINRGWAQGATSSSPLVFASVADSTAISNTTTETEFSKSFSVPANNLAVGSVIQVYGFGTYNGTGGGTGDLYVRVGGTRLTGKAANALLAATTPWTIFGSGIVRTAGSGGTLQPAETNIDVVAGASPTSPNFTSDLTASISLDTTIANTVAISWKFSTLSASNTATLKALFIRIETAANTA
jgi:hypothetical protein